MFSLTGVEWIRGTPLLSPILSVCTSSFLLFGYDQGVMSGVVISSYWLADMGHPSTIMVPTITALYDVGAVFGAIGAAFTTEQLGRKRSLIFGSAVVVVVGSILMGTCVEMIQMMVGRIVTGVGIGFVTSVAPVYQSEIVFAVYIIFVGALLPDTPRWLMWHRPSTDQGPQILARLRNKPIDHPEAVREKEDILEALALEAAEEGTWMDLFRDGGTKADKRFYLALGIQFMEEMTGINIVTYYAPTLFQDSLGISQERALFVARFLQVWYLFASFLTWYMIDVVGRRRLLVIMGLGMCVVLVAEAICVAIDNTAASIGAVFFVFAFEACFTWGWMACVWVYPPETLPLKIRAKGTALAAAADLIGNFLVVEITPPALQNIGYKTYIIFAIFNIVNTLLVWLFYPETLNLTLESVNLLFIDNGTDSSAPDGAEKIHFYQRMQWGVVPKVWDMIRDSRVRNYGFVDEAARQVQSEGLVVENDAVASGDEKGVDEDTTARAEHVN